MALTNVTVSGKYVKENPNGSGSTVAAAGTVSFTLSDVLHDPGDSQMVVPDTVVATLDNTGAFTVDLLATDDTAVFPSGLVYNVVENIEGATRSYVIQLTHTVTSVDLVTLAPSGTGALVGLLASLVTVDDSGFVVLTSATNVQLALAAIDAWLDAHSAPPSTFTNGQSIYTGALIPALADPWTNSEFGETGVTGYTVDLSRSGDVRLDDFGPYDPWTNFPFATARWMLVEAEAYHDGLVAGTAVDLKRNGVVGLPYVVGHAADNTAIRELTAYVDQAITAGTLDVEVRVNGTPLTYTERFWYNEAFANWLASANATIIITSGELGFHATSAGDVEVITDDIPIPSGANQANVNGWSLRSNGTSPRMATMTVEWLNASSAVVGTASQSLMVPPNGTLKFPKLFSSKPGTATQIRFRLHIAGAVSTENFFLVYGTQWGSVNPGIFNYNNPSGPGPVKVQLSNLTGQFVSLAMDNPDYDDLNYVQSGDRITFHATPSGSLSPVPRVIAKVALSQA